MDEGLCWLDWVFSKLRFRSTILSAAVVAIGCYLMAITPLILSGQFRFALDWPLPMGACGIAWSLTVYRWISRPYKSIVRSVRPIIARGQKGTFDSEVNTALGLMANAGAHIVDGILVWIVLVAAMVVAYVSLPDGGSIVFMPFLPTGWGDRELFIWRMASVGVFILPVMLIATTGAWILVRHMVLTCRIAELDFISSPSVCIRVTEPMLRFGVRASLIWSTGLGFVVLLFRPEWNPSRMIVLLLLAVIGISAFVIPLMALRRKLLLMKEQRIRNYVDLILPKIQKRNLDVRTIEEVFGLEKQMDFYDRIDTWFLGWKYAFWSVGSVIIPLTAAVLQARLQ